MKKLVFLSLFVGLMFVTGCRRDGGAIVIGENNGPISGSIKGRLDRNFIIVLPSNITTGFSWQLDEFEPGIVEVVSQQYKQAEDAQDVIGAGGQEVWTFKAVGVGEITLHFRYIRPWESDMPPANTADIVITTTK